MRFDRSKKRSCKDEAKVHPRSVDKRGKAKGRTRFNGQRSRGGRLENHPLRDTTVVPSKAHRSLSGLIDFSWQRAADPCKRKVIVQARGKPKLRSRRGAAWTFAELSTSGDCSGGKWPSITTPASASTTGPSLLLTENRSGRGKLKEIRTHNHENPRFRRSCWRTWGSISPFGGMANFTV